MSPTHGCVVASENTISDCRRIGRTGQNAESGQNPRAGHRMVAGARVMAGKSKHERLSAKGAQNTLDPVFAHGNPNPDRIGCPPQPVLEQLARRALPIDDAWYDHLAECSPCYREFRSLQVPQNPKTFKAGSLAAAIVVGVLGIAATGYWVSYRQDRSIQIAKTSRPPQTRPVPTAPQVVDLANLRQSRGLGPGPN